MATGEKKEKLIIFDTTLRDGEQSPGVTLTLEEKVEIAKNLCRLGVNVLEAGFPIASQGDFEAVSAIAKQVGNYLPDTRSDFMTICGLARATKNDIQRAFEAIKYAPSHRIHTFLATSDIHLKHKLKISREECKLRAIEAVSYARSLSEDVEFSPEDAGRSDVDFLCDILGSVVEAGARTLNIPDTVGYNTPEEYGNLIRYLIQNTRNSHLVTWSTHCHNDLGLATANTLAGIQNGARQVEVTINGIGERAGNTALEEIVMAIYTHPSSFPVYSTIITEQIYRVSQMVALKTGMLVQSNKAIVGANAFAHESGIHQDGVLKCQQTYEIIEPSVVGVPSNSIVLGKHSGRNAFKTRLIELGYKDIAAKDEMFQAAFQSFKAAADAKKNIMDEDIIALLSDSSGISLELFSVKSIHVVSSSTLSAHENTASATAIVCLIDRRSQVSNTDKNEEIEITGEATGKGHISAIFQCINRLVGLPANALLVDYEVKSVTEGDDALGMVNVRIKNPNLSDKVVFQGNAHHWDVAMSSAKAYVRALNRMISYKSSFACGEYKMGTDE